MASDSSIFTVRSDTEMPIPTTQIVGYYIIMMALLLRNALALIWPLPRQIYRRTTNKPPPSYPSSDNCTHHFDWLNKGSDGTCSCHATLIKNYHKGSQNPLQKFGDGNATLRWRRKQNVVRRLSKCGEGSCFSPSSS